LKLKLLMLTSKLAVVIVIAVLLLLAGAAWCLGARSLGLHFSC
jgi:hypothetical protein